VTGTFGQDAGGYFLRGIEISGGAQPVFPVDDGVVVAAHSAACPVASGLGSFVVVEHDQAFRSVYAHLETESLPRVGMIVGPESRIGVVGESGQVRRRALRLFIIDLERAEYVNPVLLLPDLTDETRPTIGAVFARTDDSLYDLRETRALPPGAYELSAEISDRFEPTTGAARVSPYSVRTFVSGHESFSLVMGRITVDAEGARIVPGGVSSTRLHAAEGLMRIGEITVGAGQSQIEIVAADFAGNETIWRATVTSLAPTPGVESSP